MEKWPNLFIVGAPKAGTTSLYAYLEKIPDIFMSKIKEPNFFAINTIPNNSILKPIRDKKKYLNLFKKGKKQKFLGEASPNYLSDPEAPKLIHNQVPAAHIIILLRDPVERFFSHYLMLYSLGRLKTSFNDSIEESIRQNKINYKKNMLRLRTGLYSDDVLRYLEIFGSKHVKILIFEEFIENPKKTIEDILDFLNIKQTIEGLEKKIYNPFSVPTTSLSKNIMKSSTIRKIIQSNIIPLKIRKFVREKILFKSEKKPKMDEKDKKPLIEFYQEDVKKLEDILGRKLPWKNFNH